MLIDLTDTNKDGKIDCKEFHRMVYAEDIAATNAASQDKADENFDLIAESSNESDGDEQQINVEPMADDAIEDEFAEGEVDAGD